MKSELNNLIEQTIDNNMASGTIDIGIRDIFFELKNNTRYFFAVIA